MLSSMHTYPLGMRPALREPEEIKKHASPLVSIHRYIDLYLCISLYIYLYICIYIYIYTHTHIYIHICVYIYIYIYICVCVYVYIYIGMRPALRELEEIKKHASPLVCISMLVLIFRLDCIHCSISIHVYLGVRPA